MKTLSLKQPFAELLVTGKKKIELRKWNTNFRGEFLIHASKQPDKKAMKKFGFSKNELPLGAITGKAILKEVKSYNNQRELEKDKEMHLADSSFGNYGFIIENPRKIKPIKAKGNLGFWEFELNEQKI
ncbi:MAG: ASCH domain-containing protein [Minisyncoccales bacterium]